MIQQINAGSFYEVECVIKDKDGNIKDTETKTVSGEDLIAGSL